MAKINSFAGVQEVKNLIESSEEVAKAVEEIENNGMAKTWGGMRFDEPKIELIGRDYSGGNPNGGNGSTNYYLVKIGYSLNMDWNGFSDTMMIYVSEWSYTAMKFPNQKRLVINAMNMNMPASKGIKIDKILYSIKDQK